MISASRESARIRQWRSWYSRLLKNQLAGTMVMLGGTACATLLIMLLDHLGINLPNPGLVYLPLVAMLSYYWGALQAVLGTLLALCAVYFFFVSPRSTLKSLTEASSAQLVTLAAVTGFVLAIVQLARHRRRLAEREAQRLTALNTVSTALASELNQERLLRLIAETACDLTGAGFAAFTLRPIDEFGQPLVPSEGNLFRLAAVVGVTKEQEAVLRKMALGGEGLLAPIFRYGKPVRVADALAMTHSPGAGEEGKAHSHRAENREAARRAAFDYVHGQVSASALHYTGVPRNHPVVRSFLGAPLLDRRGQVRGGLLLGHVEPDQFTAGDETLLVGLATQAAVALDNAQLFQAAQAQAQELDTIFESIADGIALVDEQGNVLRENRTARRLRTALGENTGESQTAASLLQTSFDEREPGTTVQVMDEHKEQREYLVSASQLRQPGEISGPLLRREEEREIDSVPGKQGTQAGAVVVWHDVTEAHHLLMEQRAHAETEAQRALLQTVMDELPSGVYMVRGRDARLVMANRAVATVWGATWEPGQPMADFLTEHDIHVFHEDGRPLSIDEFATLRAVREGMAVRHQQEIIHHPDGTILPVLVNAVNLDSRALDLSATTENGEPEPAVIVVHQDVTALKEAERLKDEFIGIAAHELRTPLAVLKGFVQMLLLQTARGNGPELADWQMEAMQDIDQATARLVELTEDLLDVTRLQAGRLSLHLEPTDLVALARRVVVRLQVTTQRHPITVHSLSQYVVANVDVHRFEQVLTNLINNAIKYSPEGGEIDILVREDSSIEEAVLSVQDHGIGIPVQQQARIFSRFMRAENARVREIGGTGLGLYLSRELIERHSGRIWFESVENQGTTFYISLPLVVEDPSPETIEAVEGNKRS